MPTIALSTGSLYSYGLARVFEMAAQAGFEAIEVLVDHRWDSRQPVYLRRLSQEHNLPIIAIHSPFVILHTPGWPRDALGRLRESVGLAREVGARVVVAHLPLRIRGVRLEFFGFQRQGLLLPLPLGGERAYRDFLLNGLAGYERREEVLIGVENMPSRRFLGHPFDIHDLNTPEAMSRLPHLTLDTTHIGTWGWDLLAVYEQLKERIVHVHLSDFDGQEHRLLGSGQLPLAELLRWNWGPRPCMQRTQTWLKRTCGKRWPFAASTWRTDAAQMGTGSQRPAIPDYPLSSSNNRSVL